MPTPQIVRFPLDPTGISTNNFVQAEPVTMVHRITRAIAPQYGAFYTQSLRVFDGVSNVELVRGVQYYAAELYEVPTAKYGKEVCAIIIIKDTSVSDTVLLNYQAVGGEFSASVEAIVSQINNLQNDTRPVRWGDIIDKPSEYTPTDHLHDLGDIYGFESLVHAVNRVRAAVLLGDSASHDEIYRYIDQQIATAASAAVAAYQTLINHVSNTSNPHITTATQVGLGNVENLPLASQVEAETGQANNRYMTPLGTKAAIALATIASKAELKTHTDNVSNPHVTTKIHVGLGLVQNYPVATNEEAETGISTSTYLTPSNMKAALAKLPSPDLGNLLQSRANGLYYGLIAPDNVANLFIDNVFGNDASVGTRDMPMKTIQAALARGPGGIGRVLFLKETQIHLVDPANKAILRGGYLTIHPYGPLIDMIPNPWGGSKETSPAALNLGTTIKALDHINVGLELYQGGSGVFQQALAFLAEKATVFVSGITLIAGNENTSGISQSRNHGSFSVYHIDSDWYFLSAKLVMPTTGSYIFDESLFSTLRVTLYGVQLEGLGYLTIAGSKKLSIDVSYINISQADFIAKILSAQSNPYMYTNFTTNLSP